MATKLSDIMEWLAAIKEWMIALKELLALLKEIFPDDSKTRSEVAKAIILGKAQA